MASGSGFSFVARARALGTARLGMGKIFLALLPFVALAPGCPAFADRASRSPTITSQEARNKTVAARVFEEIFNQGKFQVAGEIYAKDFVNHGLHRNAELQEDQAAVHAEKSAFPDLTMTVILMVAKDDLVTVVWACGAPIRAPDTTACLRRA